MFLKSEKRKCIIGTIQAVQMICASGVQKNQDSCWAERSGGLHGEGDVGHRSCKLLDDRLQCPPY